MNSRSPSAFIKDGDATLFLHHVPEEQGIADDISTPHALRLLDEKIEPLQDMALPPDRSTLHSSGEEVEDGTDGASMTMDIQLVPMTIRLQQAKALQSVL